MNEEIRDFKGIWIPKEIWLDKRISALDKIVLMEIDSLDNSDKGCYASNKHIAEFCQCSEATVTRSIAKLTEFGYLYVYQQAGKPRIVKTSINKSDTLVKMIRHPNQNDDTPRQNDYPPRQNDDQVKIISNINNNTIREKENIKRKRENTDFDKILSGIKDDELKELYCEYIKMRKLIKSPMTDRALTMLIRKVNELEPSSINRQKQLLETAIMNNWKSVYPLRDGQQQNKKIAFNNFSGDDNMSELEIKVFRKRMGIE